MGALGLDLHAHGLLQTQLLGDLGLEAVITADIEVELAVLQMQDVVDGVVEQLPVVADHHGGVRVLLQPRLEPQGPFQVEVVGGLVEQQKVGRREQRRGQRHAHPPAAGELGHRSRQIGVGEAEARQDLGGAAGRPVGVDLDKPGVDLAHVLRLGGLQVGQQGRTFDIGGQHGFQQRHGRRRVLLVHRADAGGARQADLAGAQHELIQDQLEERRLAHAVAANEAHLGVLGQADGRLVEEPAAPGVEYEVFDLQHRRNRETGADQRFAGPAEEGIGQG